ncbi:aromatic ring-hydroxylating oxygenase subunit alpha [Candidatus Poriferisodalis sp.]|uniref:aromatic ring-hydroxylating oxygenase subunit alpha n=1 Tax=Candidatus Poriferisodalis sp. TaxID=3101277 RepID=UPI003B59E1BE
MSDSSEVDLSGTRAALDQATHAPGAIYASPEIFRREVAEYFKREWLYVGRVEELADPGDYMALRLVGEPVLLSRDREGQLHANYNMCVHRGVEVAYGSGNLKAFSCPYHGWVYGLDGQLKGAAYMAETKGFDVADCALTPLRLDVWRGNIFINFDHDAGPLADAMAGIDEEFSFLGWEKCRLGNKLEIDLACNWKFIHENLMDFYHVGVLHADSFGANFKFEPDHVNVKPDGGLSIFYDAGPPTPGAEPLLGKMPWLTDRPHSFACTAFTSPNLTFFGRIDCIRPMIAWPIDEGRTRVVIYHLFPEEFFDRPDFAETLKIYHDFQILVLEEDRIMIESMQQAMSSPAYRPGRMSTLEKGVHNFLNGYLDRVIGGATP